jgi:hypothetical protein
MEVPNQKLHPAKKTAILVGGQGVSIACGVLGSIHTRSSGKKLPQGVMGYVVVGML